MTPSTGLPSRTVKGRMKPASRAPIRLASARIAWLSLNTISTVFSTPESNSWRYTNPSAASVVACPQKARLNRQ